MYKIYYYWENRPGYTSASAKSLASAMSIARYRAHNHKNLMSVEIVDNNYYRIFVSREELLGPEEILEEKYEYERLL